MTGQRLRVFRVASSVIHHTVLLHLLAFSGLLTAQGQSYRSLVAQADSMYEAKEYGGSLQKYDQAFAIERTNPADLYNAACSAALAQQRERAYELLESAVDRGWTNTGHANGDPDLISLRGNKRWEELIARMEQRRDRIESRYNKPLQKELLRIRDDDQKYRMMVDSVRAKYGYDSRQMQDLWRAINAIDSINLIKVRRILDTEGWVSPDTVGGDASQALFLVVQHADLKTQEKYLPMMKTAVAAGNAAAADLALLIDRVEMRNGRPQIYGSQIDMKDGKYSIYPILDEVHVNMRRAEVGLPPLEQYVKRWNIQYTPPPK